MSQSKVMDIELLDVANDRGSTTPGVRATCPECGSTTESFGQEKKSLRRCMALMRDVCRCSDAAGSFFTCDELE